MSIWAHVAGVIRFDGIPGMPHLAPDLGKTVRFDDPPHMWEECDTPRGSEGSIHTSLWTNSGNSLARWTATIWGDLRDVDTTEDIIQYLNRIVDGKLVRQGVVEIEVEGRDTTVLRYDSDGKAWRLMEPFMEGA